MNIPFYQVDAFTREPFKGNPAAVCLLSEPLPEDMMKMIAREMNLSETAFVHPEGDGFRLRWFTPRVEAKLCGHATLASAHVLYTLGRLAAETPAVFHTLSGVLTARKNDDRIELDFPTRQTTPTPPPDGLLEALGIEAVNTASYGTDFLVELADEGAVRGASPDFVKLGKVETRAVAITARSSSSQYDIVSRFFAPRVGVNEDPVTGSTHCALVTYWCAKLGKNALNAFQASERGGELTLTLQGERVRIGGEVVLVAEGMLRL